MIPACEATGKARYTRREAARAASWWRRKRFAPMTHYRCRRCGDWHIGNRLVGARRRR